MTARIWLDDRFVDAADARIDPSDRGLLLADGAFDTALALAGRAFRRAAHLERLSTTLAALGMSLDPSRLVTAHDALAETCGNGSIRLTVTRGPGPRGLGFPPEPRPTILGSLAPLNAGAMFAPLTLRETAIRRNETSPASRLKTLGYLDAVLANAEARGAGADEALFFNTGGRLACSALANVFVLAGEALLTPPVSDGVLPGIVRGWVLENAGRFGLEAVERSIGRGAIGGPARLFVSNSLRLLAPARLVGAPAAPVPAPMLRLMEGLCAAVAAECGADPRALGARLPA